MIPITLDDLAANGLLGEAHRQPCWERSVESLIARKDEITGLAVASDERIEAYLLYVSGGVGSQGQPAAERRTGTPELEILALRSCIEDEGGARLKRLLSRLSAQGMRAFRFPKAHQDEISMELLDTLGFRPAAVHRLYAARARAG